MNMKCPCCHATFSIEAVIEDESARELLKSALKDELPSALIPYLTLFRSESRALSWSRMVRLSREVLDLCTVGVTLIQLDAAMTDTVESLRGRGKGALKNHNYLKRVLESQAGTAMTQDLVTKPKPPAHEVRSKTASALTRLENWKRG
jgi:hypothetical protein